MAVYMWLVIGLLMMASTMRRLTARPTEVHTYVSFPLLLGIIGTIRRQMVAMPHQWIPMNKVHGAVNGVDDPCRMVAERLHHAAVAFRYGLLADEPVVGEQL